MFIQSNPNPKNRVVAMAETTAVGEATITV